MKFAELKTVYNALMSVKCRINNELAESYNPRKHTGYYDFLLGKVRFAIEEALRLIERSYFLLYNVQCTVMCYNIKRTMYGGDSMIIDTDDYIDASEAIKILGIKRSWLSQLCRDGKLNCVKIGHSWIINRKDVRSRLNKNVQCTELSEEDERKFKEVQTMVENNDPMVQRIINLRRKFTHDTAKN